MFRYYKIVKKYIKTTCQYSTKNGFSKVSKEKKMELDETFGPMSFAHTNDGYCGFSSSSSNWQALNGGCAERIYFCLVMMCSFAGQSIDRDNKNKRIL